MFSFYLFLFLLFPNEELIGISLLAVDSFGFLL